jgi:hypothetical protein
VSRLRSEVQDVVGQISSVSEYYVDEMDLPSGVVSVNRTTGTSDLFAPCGTTNSVSNVFVDVDGPTFGLGLSQLTNRDRESLQRRSDE